MVVSPAFATRRRFLVAVLIGSLAWLALPALALAQASYPDRPIKLIIPYAPGGVYDAVGRPWAEKMGITLGTIVIENRGGGGGSVGAAGAAAAEPDGYTLFLGGSGPSVVNPLTGLTTYDPIKDFVPIALVAKAPFAIAVHPKVPAASLTELVAYARSNAGKLSYASAGTGSSTHLTGELFKSLTGLADIAHVPYKVAGPAIADVVGGHVAIGVPTLNGQVLGLHRSGQVRILAVTGPERVASATDIPTAAESIPGLVSENFLMVFAPKGTPKAIVDKVQSASAKAMQYEDLQKAFMAGGLEPVRDSDPESAKAYLQDELTRWAPLVQSLGLKK